MTYSKQARIVLAAGIVFTTGTTPSNGAFAQDNHAHGINNALLVHGAWANGSSWSKVIPLLTARGLHVVAVELPLTSLADDVATTERALALETGPVLLVNPCGRRASARPDYDVLQIDSERSFRRFRSDLAEVERRTLFIIQGPTGAAALGATISDPAWKNKPNWFIVARQERIISPQLEEMEAQRMNATTITLNTNHVAMLSDPIRVADFIARAAADGDKNEE
jgi:pimeloyl-ACP methyl ester carboxylesterase